MSNKLTPHEAQSAVWKKVKEVLNERLDKHRASNDKNLDEVSTAKLRGQIAEIKFLLDLDKPNPAPTKDADE